MSEGHEPHEHPHTHEHSSPAVAPFRFEAFADADAAKAAFEAVYPSGSSIEPALKTLIDMGAQCKSVAPGRIACRYVEQAVGLGGWCWHVALECNSEKAIQHVGVALATTAA